MSIISFISAEMAKAKAEFLTGEHKTFKQKRKEVSNNWRDRHKKD